MAIFRRYHTFRWQDLAQNCGRRTLAWKLHLDFAVQVSDGSTRKWDG
jgi:hypothetical protein